MLSRIPPDRSHVAFDDHRLVDNAGLILPATLAPHLRLPELVDRRLDLGAFAGQALACGDRASMHLIPRSATTTAPFSGFGVRTRDPTLTIRFQRRSRFFGQDPNI